jgi:uncharacterized protein (DUF849 family)
VADDLKNKRIITIATTGAWPHKSDNPNVPLTPEEIVHDVYECWKIGAAVCHIHVRNSEGKAAMDFPNFQKTVTLLKEQHPDCDIVVNLTTSGGVNLKEEDRFRPVIELEPEMASYDCGTMNWLDTTIFENNPKFLEKLATLMNEHNVKPEIEAFDPGMIYNAQRLIKKGFLKTPLHFQMCMGSPGGIMGTPKNLVFMKGIMDEVAPGSTWSAFGVGQYCMPVMYTTLALGGHIRVGMEDNVQIRRHVLAKSNMEFVERARRVIEEFGNEVATPAEARQILSLPPKK